MKKYLVTASLFALNAEVISWFALLVIAVMAFVDFYKAVEKERGARWTE